MPYDDYRTIRVALDGGIARVTLDHPPINLLDLELILELDAAGRALEADPGSGWWSSTRRTRSSSPPTPT
ncbi:MAG TPA: hypothetical protein VMU76_01515 [Acidimicrobiales bacterium]|nr:hypothetical protein [Acidimicrobiales bacterium]